MQKYFQKLIGFFAKPENDDESGATAIEYGLIAALISVAIVGAASTLGSNLSDAFKEVATQMDVA